MGSGRGEGKRAGDKREGLEDLKFFFGRGTNRSD